jgi:NTP pyrophosphatase (non-canonical NTP hydrolase)
MNDLYELKKKVIDFRDKRNWRQFHSIKDLLIGLNIECSELMEHFLWKSESEIDEMLKDKKTKRELENEMGDIFIFLLYLSEDMNIDILSAAGKKLRLNSLKYPVKKSYNSNKKYNRL